MEGEAQLAVGVGQLAARSRHPHPIELVVAVDAQVVFKVNEEGFAPGFDGPHPLPREGGFVGFEVIKGEVHLADGGTNEGGGHAIGGAADFWTFGHGWVRTLGTFEEWWGIPIAPCIVAPKSRRGCSAVPPLPLAPWIL
ncbi:MAG: hypothetical protein Fur0042_15730 [Cyanophyceae cyanobacterium]